MGTKPKSVEVTASSLFIGPNGTPEIIYPTVRRVAPRPLRNIRHTFRPTLINTPTAVLIPATQPTRGHWNNQTTQMIQETRPILDHQDTRGHPHIGDRQATMDHPDDMVRQEIMDHQGTRGLQALQVTRAPRGARGILDFQASRRLM